MIEKNTDVSKYFSFAQLCDPQLGMGGYRHDVKALTQALRRINKMGVDFVVNCGDLVDTPKKEDFADYKQIIKKLNVPIYNVPGNHDIGNKPTAKSLALFREEIGKDRFSFLHKGSTFVFLNTLLWKEHLDGETAQQDIWLNKILTRAKNARSPVFIVGHNPLFIETPDGNKFPYFTIPKKKRKELLELFTTHNVVAVLTGHTHWLVINEYKGIKMVSGESTSKNSDDRPLGFRHWIIEGSNKITHNFVPINLEE